MGKFKECKGLALGAKLAKIRVAKLGAKPRAPTQIFIVVLELCARNPRGDINECICIF